MTRSENRFVLTALLGALAYVAVGAPGPLAPADAESTTTRQSAPAQQHVGEWSTFRNATDKDAVVYLHTAHHGRPVWSADRLSRKLDLVVREARTGRIAYRGSLHQPGPIEVGRLGPGEARAYSVGLVVAKGLGETFAAEKATTSVDWAWTVSGE